MTETYAVLIGIEHYPDWPRANIPGPCANAVAVARQLLSLGLPAEHLMLFLAPDGDLLGPFGEREPVIAGLKQRGALIHERADHATLDTFLRRELVAQRAPGSRLLFYWSGHGYTHNSGERMFICGDYSPGELQNRVFSAGSIRHYLRSEHCSCFREQLFLADVCGNFTGSVLEADRFAGVRPHRGTRQHAYFATPEGEYARVDDGIGLFTRIITDTLGSFDSWPDLDQLAQSIQEAFARCEQKPFRVDIGDQFNDLQGQLFGKLPQGEGDALFRSLWSLLSPIGIPESVYRCHYLRIVNLIGQPAMYAAQGLTGMLRELTGLADREGGTKIPYNLIRFLLSLSHESALKQPIDAWLASWAMAQQHELASAREHIEQERGKKILIVEVKNDSAGNISQFESSLRNLDLVPVSETSFDRGKVADWADFQKQIGAVIEELAAQHDLFDFQVHCIVDPPLFDKPFHQIPFRNRLLGEEAVVLVRHRERHRRPRAHILERWRQQADALRRRHPRSVPTLPIPDPNLVELELSTDPAAIRYACFAVPQDSDSRLEKDLLLRLLRLGVPYLCWSHVRLPNNNWAPLERCLSRCLCSPSAPSIDDLPSEYTALRVARNPVAGRATLLWDDPESKPFIQHRGIQER